MAKRFTDTEKWKNDWFLELSNDHRIVWQYICDNCSISGVLKKNFKLLNFCCNTNLTERSFLKIFNGRALPSEDFFFFPKFLKFQYPKGVNTEKPVHRAIRFELEKNNLTQTVIELFGNDYLTITNGRLTIKDKDT